jgi:hypothetical protein
VRPAAHLPQGPVYHHKRESIDAHLSVRFAAPAVTRFIEARTGWSIKKFVRTARRYRTIQVRAGTKRSDAKAASRSALDGGLPRRKKTARMTRDWAV